MTMISAAEAAQLPLSTDDEIVERVGELVGAAIRRQVWLLLLDERDVQIPVLIPVGDLPPWPGDEGAVFARHLAEAVHNTAVAGVVVVWERPGGAALDDEDRAWAREISLGFAGADLAVRGQLLSHDQGVRWLPPDEYV
ncbi:MAG: hypothetical protein ACTHON_05365 [Humibacter sp.]